MQRIIIICSFFIFLSTTSKAQFGVSTQFLSYPLNDWEEVIGDDFYDASYGLAIDYWARLKNYRWEMVPTISGNFKYISQKDKKEGDLNLTSAKFHVKNNIYLLDFKNDCNCPTFSKQSGWFKKSFFLQVAPGYSFTKLSQNGLSEDQNIHLFELGLGAGFDFGLSDLVTISPYFNYVITPRFKQKFFSTEEMDFKTNLNYFLVGLRVGLRPDYARPTYKRRRALRY